MKKKLFVFILLIGLLLPVNIFALSSNYKDVVSDYVNVDVDKDKVNLYLFRGEGCPHCRDEEKWLLGIEDKYKDKLNIYKYEVWHDEDNAKIMQEVKSELNATETGVPFTVIGKSYYVGYSDVIGSRIEDKIDSYLNASGSSSKKITVPLLGKVDAKKVSIPLVAIILGFIDGFNPCAMWILLFLINMFFTMKNKKKAWVLGFIFLFVSAFVYFLSMLGINLVIGALAVSYLKIIIGLFILGAGIYNFRKYLQIRDEEAGCVVVDDKKRKKLITKIRSIMESKSFILAVVGVITLAASVNLVELACSLGFPMIFTELLSLNNVTGISRILYLLLYILFYMIDDLFVFTVSMITLEATGITNKYNKLCTLVSSIIMIIMGLLLVFKPEWLMLNF